MKINTRIRILKAFCIILLAAFTLSSIGIALFLYDAYTAHQNNETYRSMVDFPRGTSHTADLYRGNPLKKLMMLNDDAVAFLEIPSHSIFLPVVQGTDNKFYLHHDFEKNASRFGTLFLHSQNAPDFSDRLSVIYGHNIPGSNTMFTPLQEFYADSALLDKCKVYVTTANERTLYTAKAFYQVPESFSYGQTAITTNQEISEYLDRLSPYLIKGSPVPVSDDTKLLGLGTCTNNLRNDRLLLLCLPESDS